MSKRDANTEPVPEKKTHVIVFRLTPTMHEDIKDAAALEGISQQRWMEEAVDSVIYEGHYEDDAAPTPSPGGGA